MPLFAFQVPLKWIDEAQIITATIDRRKVQVHGQLDVYRRLFRRLLRRFFRFIAKDHAQYRPRYATRGIAPTSPSQTGATNRRQCNCSYEAWNRLEFSKKFSKTTRRPTEFSDFPEISFANSDIDTSAGGLLRTRRIGRAEGSLPRARDIRGWSRACRRNRRRQRRRRILAREVRVGGRSGTC